MHHIQQRDSHQAAIRADFRGSCLGEGSESYAPLAQALIAGLTLSVALTVFLVPAGFLLAYRTQEL